jgi:hypothetical protein
MENQKATSSGIGLGSIIFVVFLVLKLAGIGEVANWSWWWVTSPLWIPLVLVVAILAIVGIIGGIASLFE